MTTEPTAAPPEDTPASATAPVTLDPVDIAKRGLTEAHKVKVDALAAKRREREAVNVAIAKLVAEEAELRRALNALDRPKRVKAKTT